MQEYGSLRLGALSAQQTAPRAAFHCLLRISIVAKWPTSVEGGVSRHYHSRIAPRSSNSDVVLSTVLRKKGNTSGGKETKRQGRGQKNSWLRGRLHDFPPLESSLGAAQSATRIETLWRTDTITSCCAATTLNSHHQRATTATLRER